MIRRLIILLLIVGCDNNSLNDTNKNTYYDAIADITYLNGSFFTTNYDLSNNAGSQIDLIKFKYENDSSAYLDNSYDLNMNGQGYLAITNNGLDLFLQSKESHLIVKCSAIGEFAITTMDTIDANWQPCGLTFNNDSLISLYRNLDTLTQYRARTISQDLSFSTSSDITFNLDFIDTTYHGVYAIESKGAFYYMLGVDTTQNDILIITNDSFEVTALDTIPDSTVVGLCFKDDDLYFSYRERIIKKWKFYTN
jgi:hypothetical protein